MVGSSLTVEIPRGPAEIRSLEGRREFGMLEKWILSPETLKRPLHEVEAEEFERAREVCRLLLEEHIRARGVGEVGTAIEVTEGDDQRVHSHRRLQVCGQKTLFGEVEIERLAYALPGHDSVRPLDQQLALPERSFSQEVQRMGVLRAVQGPFDEAVDHVASVTGLEVSKRSVEQIVRDSAVDFDAFYQETEPSVEDTGPIVVGSVDGKGIPMVKPEGAEKVVRRGKGQKANKKRMATVATVYTTVPRVRTPEEVVESLFRPKLKLVDRKKDRKARTGPEQKRVWASLKDGKEAVIRQMAEEMKLRDPKGEKKQTVLTDGERVLQRLVLQVLPGVLLILDLLHVLEKLWKVAHVFYEERSPEAEAWVKAHALMILQGKVSQVVKGMRQSATKRGLVGEAKKTVACVSAYLYHNRAFMRYHEYLAEGLPIASGAVEGACKNLVKDRFERSGMRWTEDTAEAMLKLRATYLSGDFEDYWDFHLEKEQQRLYGGKNWRPFVVAK